VRPSPCGAAERDPAVNQPFVGNNNRDPTSASSALVLVDELGTGNASSNSRSWPWVSRRVLQVAKLLSEQQSAWHYDIDTVWYICQDHLVLNEQRNNIVLIVEGGQSRAGRERTHDTGCLDQKLITLPKNN
jgi:hypothetical protein